MPEAESAVTTHARPARFPSDAEPHLVNIERGLRIIAIIEADAGPSTLDLVSYVIERLAVDARALRAALWPEVRP